jgi:hypothetical protein
MSRSLLLLLVLASDIHQLLCGSIEKRIRELRSILKRNNAGKLTNALLANNNVMHYTGNNIKCASQENQACVFSIRRN